MGKIEVKQMKSEVEEWPDTLPEVECSNLEDMVGENLTKEERLAELARLFTEYFVQFSCRPASPQHPGALYNPKEDSVAWREFLIGNVAVIISMPQTMQTVVASYWGDYYDEFNNPIRTDVHIDVADVLKAIIAHHDMFKAVKYHG